MRMRWLVALSLLVSGCVQSGVVECAQGNVCPEAFVCAPAGGCYSPAQVDACGALADGMTCTVDGRMGACAGGGCLVPVCGNAVVEPGEACDDGNQLGGDG